MKIGDYFVLPLSEGRLTCDGGVVFGTMPKSAWSRLIPADEDNSIQMSLTGFLVQGKGHNILVDPGIGDKRDDEALAAMGVDLSVAMDVLLENLGLTRGDIDAVVLSDLDVSRAGALTRMNADGALVPGFPGARVVVQNGEWERAIHANLRTRDRYNKEDFESLLWHQSLNLVDGDNEVIPGLSGHVTGGPTKFHQVLVLQSEGEGGIFWGDLIPTVHHVALNTISARDLYPLRSMEQKAEWLSRAVEKQWVSFFSRDPSLCAALVTGDIRAGVNVKPLITHEE